MLQDYQNWHQFLKEGKNLKVDLFSAEISVYKIGNMTWVPKPEKETVTKRKKKNIPHLLYE